jgi:hypothetical protein
MASAMGIMMVSDLVYAIWNISVERVPISKGKEVVGWSTFEAFFYA